MGPAAQLTEWKFACPDWQARLKSGRSLVPELPLNQEEAGRAVGIFNKLRLPDVAGRPAMLEAAGEWQRDIVRAIFGSLVDGVRMVPELFVMVPKKNSKTTGGAAISLTAVLMNVRPRADFIYVGPTQEVADGAFQQAAGMVDADPEGYLQKRFHVSEHIKTIVDRRTKAKLKIKTFDMKVVTGSKPVFILLDELHLMSSMSQASRILGQLRGGMLANPEAVLIIITTQSDEPPSGVFKSELNYAREVRDGKITKGVHMLPILYEFPEKMQSDAGMPWRDTKNWPMVMPNLNRPMTIERLEAEFQAAKDKGEEEERRWASQHLNIQIGIATHDDRWRGTDYWLGAADASLTLDEILRRSDVVTVGIDGGGLDDLLGLGAIGRCKVTRDWLCWNHAWAQRDVLDLRKDIAEKLRDFEADGDLTFCDDAQQDIRELVEYIVKIKDSGLLPEKLGVGLDPFAIAAIVDALAEKKIEGEVLTAVRQGSALSPASWGLERKLKDGTFWHSGSGLMTWCVGNAKTEQRGNAVLITKQTAGKAKIDPLVATFNAAMLMSRNPEALGKGAQGYFEALKGAA